MIMLYELGALLLVHDPYNHVDCVCIVLGVASVNVYGAEDDILYKGYSLTDNCPYYFFGIDIISRIENY